jgi:hypothetical protein
VRKGVSFRCIVHPDDGTGNECKEECGVHTTLGEQRAQPMLGFTAALGVMACKAMLYGRVKSSSYVCQ